MGIRPVHVLVDVVVVAVDVAHLAGHDREPPGDGGDRLPPAREVAGAEVWALVVVEGSGDSVKRIVRAPSEPATEIAGPADPRNHDHVLRAMSTDGVDQPLRS